MHSRKWSLALLLVVACLAATSVIPLWAQQYQAPLIPSPPSDYATRQETERVTLCIIGRGSCEGLVMGSATRDQIPLIPPPPDDDLPAATFIRGVVSNAQIDRRIDAKLKRLLEQLGFYRQEALREIRNTRQGVSENRRLIGELQSDHKKLRDDLENLKKEFQDSGRVGVLERWVVQHRLVQHGVPLLGWTVLWILVFLALLLAAAALARDPNRRYWYWPPTWRRGTVVVTPPATPTAVVTPAPAPTPGAPVVTPTTVPPAAAPTTPPTTQVTVAPSAPATPTTPAPSAPQAAAPRTAAAPQTQPAAAQYEVLGAIGIWHYVTDGGQVVSVSSGIVELEVPAGRYSKYRVHSRTEVANVDPPEAWKTGKIKVRAGKPFEAKVTVWSDENVPFSAIQLNQQVVGPAWALGKLVYAWVQIGEGDQRRYNLEVKEWNDFNLPLSSLAGSVAQEVLRPGTAVHVIIRVATGEPQLLSAA